MILNNTSLTMNNIPLAFNYIPLPRRYIAHYRNNKWNPGRLTCGNKLVLSQSAIGLNYGQCCFEGIKAQKMLNGKIGIFRPFDHAIRLNNSAKRLLMPEIDVADFIKSISKVVHANRSYIPASNVGSMYVRPLYIGTSPKLGINPSEEYILCVYCSPVGNYLKSNINLLVSDYDRASPNGVGNIKACGNYACNLLPVNKAKLLGYDECVYLDAKTHTKIEEIGTANFFGITADNTFVTPKSKSILPSITKDTIMFIAKNILKINVIETDVLLEDLKTHWNFEACGALGTAIGLNPIKSITQIKSKNDDIENYKSDKYELVKYDFNVNHKTILKLQEILQKIKLGSDEYEFEYPYDWIVNV